MAQLRYCQPETRLWYSYPHRFDTLIAARSQLQSTWSAHLIQRHFGIVLDKVFKHDWSKDPFNEHLHYARGETHWLLALHEYMSLKLKRLNVLNMLMKSQKLTLREWNDQRAQVLFCV